MNTEELITTAGLKPTRARIAVLSTLAEASSAISHSEILVRMSHHKEFDRVTIYRVLDWLTEHHLIHKISGDNRAWKFQISQNTLAGQHTHQHAHLQCSACGKVICIHELEPHFPSKILAKYHVESIDINIKGLCPDCI
ncbi:MAG: transcriptional repressor [Methylotenera sp.]|uniref:Fur family transcriptional regulator n=1 Tax=Methylotenera sp. TaxID=2051956 RepID=UPI0027262934|nr:transcriptional repressor [Methylotenera sp.]MDO9205363.1 transcriptional repressor [Methylotenera sp.]MDO9394736.1 transcriptional repressor [Methylotenera sp.]MDP1523124.1 transcriptional repressor [Methylotenera sp.]MDP3307533.1 transcriptional repressor [Methylotenera sp.]MDP3819409.1 transcriptional repressor [Methylotenera sp.]